MFSLLRKPSTTLFNRSPTTGSIISRIYSSAHVSGGNSAAELERHGRIQELKQALQTDGRYQITMSEYLDLAREKAHLDESDARQLLTHLHESSTVLHFPHYHNDQQEGAPPPIYLQPQKVVSQFWDQLDRSWWIRKLQEESAEVQHLNGQLIPLRREKQRLDTLAQKSLNRWVYGTLAYLTAQTGLLAKMTWVDYGWDVVEPMTYFITFTTAIGGFVYFAMFRNEYSYESAMNRIVRRSQTKQYTKHQFDLKSFQQLEEKYEMTRQRLQERATDIFGMGRIPQEIQQVLYPDLVPDQSQEQHKSD